MLKANSFEDDFICSIYFN